MRPIFTLVIVAAAVALKATPAMAANSAKHPVELESHIKWSAVDNDWKSLRPRWVAATNACDDPECVAKQLLDLETHVKWKMAR